MFCLKIDVVDFFLKNLYSEENLKWKFDLTDSIGESVPL